MMNTSRSMQDYKRLAGIGVAYDTWQTPPAVLAESKKGAPVSRKRVAIHRMAHLLEDQRLGGSVSLPQFDEWRIDRLMEAEAAYAKSAQQHHWGARAATAAAHKQDKAGDSKASHEAHAHAAERHRQAAKHLAAAGDTHTAHVHDQWARHHEMHAAHHARAMGGVHHTAHAPVAPAAPAAAPAKKGGLVHRLKQKLKGAGGIDWAAKAAETEPHRAVHVQKDPFPSKKAPPHAAAAAAAHKAIDRHQAGLGPKQQPAHVKHSELAMKAGHAATNVSQNPNVSSHGKAQAYKRASHEHLHAALSAFHSGDHEKALQHFNAAIHHMNKHSQHMGDVAAQGRQAARRAAPVGPRAARGYAHV
jgi:hypothetical protein